jgi:hypothetical protein
VRPGGDEHRRLPSRRRARRPAHGLARAAARPLPVPGARCPLREGPPRGLGRGLRRAGGDGRVQGRHLLRIKRTPTFAHLPSGSCSLGSGRWGSIPRRPGGFHPGPRLAAAARSSSRRR